MSLDGIGVLSNDLAHDVFTTIKQSFAAGASVDDIRRQIAAYESDFVDEIDEDCFLAAALKGLWDIGISALDLRQRLLLLVENNVVQARWAAAAGDGVARKRVAVLRRLLERTELSNSNGPGRPPHRRKVRGPIYEIGDCLELHHGERTYRCLVCAVHSYGQTHAYYLVPLLLKGTASLGSLRRSRYIGHLIGHHAAQSGHVCGPHGTSVAQRVLLSSEVGVQTIGRLPLDPTLYVPGVGRGVCRVAASAIDDLERICANPRRMESFATRTLLRAA